MIIKIDMVFSFLDFESGVLTDWFPVSVFFRTVPRGFRNQEATIKTGIF